MFGAKRKRDERILNAYSHLFIKLNSMLDELDSMLNSILDDVESVLSMKYIVDLNESEAIINMIIRDLSVNKFTPPSVKLSLLTNITNISEVLDDLKRIYTGLSASFHMKNSLDDNEIKAVSLLCVNFYRSLVSAKHILGAIKALCKFEIFKIDSNYDFISNYYNKDNLYNCKITDPVKFEISFSYKRNNKGDK